MKQLNNLQNAIFLIGALLMVIGTGSSLFGWWGAPYLFALGALGFASMQMLQRYEGDDINIKRLRRIMLMSDVLLLLSALLMYAGNGNPFKLDQITYVQYIGNNWVVALLIGALLQLFTSYRLGKELEKER